MQPLRDYGVPDDRATKMSNTIQRFLRLYCHYSTAEPQLRRDGVLALAAGQGHQLVEDPRPLARRRFSIPYTDRLDQLPALPC